MAQLLVNTSFSFAAVRAQEFAWKADTVHQALQDIVAVRLCSGW
jgi:hypothetical protein